MNRRSFLGGLLSTALVALNPDKAISKNVPVEVLPPVTESNYRFDEVSGHLYHKHNVRGCLNCGWHGRDGVPAPPCRGNNKHDPLAWMEGDCLEQVRRTGKVEDAAMAIKQVLKRREES